MTNTHADTPSTSVAAGLTLLRVVLGAIFTAHGAQKVFEFSLPGTIGAFTGMGIPLAEVAAPSVAIIELVGGVLLAVGLLTRPLAVLLTGVSIGALVFVHGAAGFWASNGGFEYVLLLALACAALALTGAGKFSLDHAVLRGRVPSWLI